jgi:protein SCO1
VRPDRRGWPTWLAAVGVSAALLAACSSSAADPSSSGTAPPSASVGATTVRAVPSSILHLPLTDQHGQAVSLASWTGSTVVLVPFLTLCADICPLTTGDLSVVSRALKADHAGGRVELVELSVDPGRDSPARLAAYAKLTGVDWPLVTESPAVLASMAEFFGFEYQQVPEDDPPDIDWWTGQPLTYDVNHSDGFVIINGRGIERFATAAAPSYRGPLNPTIERFLSPLGHQHQQHPADPTYDAGDILQAIAWTIHRPLPNPAS